jgi:simple sugar transport system substrate-binding protein
VDLVGEGPVALFIATPGSLNIQPRIDGAVQAINDSRAPIEYSEIATGATEAEELNRIDAYYQGHKDVKGMFAVDAGSTAGVAQVMQKYGLHEKGVGGGGYDLVPKTVELLRDGHIDFTIDQQPYLQGFYPVVQLFLYKISGGLTGPADTNTGLVFVTQDDAGQYLETSSRYEGDSEQQKILQPA